MDIGEFDIEPEGDLNLDGRGNSAMNGPGVGSGSSGASYGGVGGGSDDSIPYGSLFSPTDLGSGGVPWYLISINAAVIVRSRNIFLNSIIPSCLILIVGNEKFPSSETNMYVPLSRRAVCEVAAILGINTTIEGKMTGVHHLYVEDGGFVSIAATSQTALLDNGIITRECPVISTSSNS
jgi:hypothetical protein